MVYLQLPIAVQLQINHFNAAGIIGISSRNDPQTTSLRRAPRNMSWEPALFSLWAMVSLGCTVTRNALLGCQLRLYRLKLIKSIQSYLGLYDGTTDTEFLNHFQWWKNFLKKSQSESLSHAWLLIWGISDHCRMINGWVLTKNVQKNIFSPMNCMKVQKPKWKVVTDHDWSGRTNAAASSGRLASLGTISRVPKAAPGMPEWRPLIIKNKIKFHGAKKIQKKLF